MGAAGICRENVQAAGWSPLTTQGGDPPLRLRTLCQRASCPGQSVQATIAKQVLLGFLEFRWI